MTGRERILTALAGDRSDRVPFVPNIWQWFHVNRSAGGFPPSWPRRPTRWGLARPGC